MTDPPRHTMTPTSPPEFTPSPVERPTRASSGRAFWVVGAVVAVLPLAVSLPAVRNGWVNWDDAHNFLDNPNFRGLGWSNLRWTLMDSVQDAHWVPLAWLTLSLDYVFWGMNPAGYHLTSLTIHAVNAFLCYVLAVRLLALGLGAGARQGELRLGGAMAALFFALHPLRVESVAWVTERRDVVMGFFALATVLAWLRAWRRGTDQRPTRAWYWVAVACFALALLSKVMVIGLPIVLLVLDVYPLRRIGRRWLGPLVSPAIVEKVPFLLLSLAAAV